MKKCYSCEQLQGKRQISPGKTIYESKYWTVEHAYPSKLKGWLVFVLKEHKEAMHELTSEEMEEIGTLLKKIIPPLRKLTDCKKEYVACFAEKEHFEHIHYHIIPREENLEPELQGSKIFAMLKVSEEEAVPREEIKEFCEQMIKELN